MSKNILMSALVVPVLLGLLAGQRRGVRTLPHALAAFALYALAYVAFLYFEYHR
jgi:hypothetical protein